MKKAETHRGEGDLTLEMAIKAGLDHLLELLNEDSGGKGIRGRGGMEPFQNRSNHCTAMDDERVDKAVRLEQCPGNTLHTCVCHSVQGDDGGYMHPPGRPSNGSVLKYSLTRHFNWV